MRALPHQVIVLETHVTSFGGIRDGTGACDVSLNVTIKTPASRIQGHVQSESVFKVQCESVFEFDLLS